MAEMTYPHLDQHYRKYIFRNSISHNLQWVEGNGDNIKFCWINFITSLLFLCKQFYIRKLKVIIIISCLMLLAISHNTLSVSLIVLVLSWISKILPQTNFSQTKYYISPHIFYKHALQTTYHQQNEVQTQSSILENGINSVRWY